MEPVISNINDTTDLLTFTLSGVNYSIAHAITRTILSDIPTAVFKTTPHDQDQSQILINTSKFTNELIKQRLGCIPIHIKDSDFNMDDHIMELNVENTTNEIQLVTTKDFKLKRIDDNTIVNAKEIFPPCDITHNHIIFLRLNPKISDTIPGEHISLTCKITTGTANEDSSYNVACTCAYGYTIDKEKQQMALIEKTKEWKNDNKDIEFESKNWLLLDGMRICTPDSFDFVIESIGVYTHIELVIIACEVLISRLKHVIDTIETNNGDCHIGVSLTSTIPNCYDVVFENQTYTVGKPLEFILYNTLYSQGTINYCSCYVSHPHNSSIALKLAFNEITNVDTIKQYVVDAIKTAIGIYEDIKHKMIV